MALKDHTDSLFNAMNEVCKQVNPEFDAIMVIRCKDCCHRAGKYCTRLQLYYVDPDWFCADAERKEE